MFRPHVLARACVLACLTAAVVPAIALCATYYVDNGNPAASDAGPGTSAFPYRTISAAVTQRGGAGTTILVLPGTYREQVTVSASGASGSPFVIEAQGAVTVDATGNTYGFRLSGRSWVTIRGFTVTRASDKGVYASSSSNSFTLQDCVVTLCGGQGAQLSGSSNGLIEGNEIAKNGDHGIVLTSGVTATTVRGNYSHDNARPTERAANGIYLYGSSGNRLESNRVGSNQDTGFQVNSSSNNNVFLQNVSWNNGDHGYDHLSSSGNRHVGDIAYGNYKDGFSFEGNAPGGQVYNCIAVNNGLTSGHFDLWVDDQSSSGFASDYNVIWNSTNQSPIKFRSTTYSSIATFNAATGQDAHSTQANPRFVNAAAGDFHLLSGSPAIDAASSSVSQWPATDAAGSPRVDDPGTPNTGSGPVTYADRGAHEFGGGGTPGTPPVAALAVTPSSGDAPLFVTADAGGSTDSDGTIVSYRFDFGDGVIVGPQAGSTATHSYGAGTWDLSVIVTDDDGLTATTLRTVTAIGPDQAPVVVAPATTVVSEAQLLTIAVTASDPDGNPILSLTADFSGLPPGHNAQFVPGSGNTTGTFTWTPSYDHAGTYVVTFRATNALTSSRSTTITVQGTDRPPAVSSPGIARGTPGSLITFDVSASDADGDAITSLTANLSALPAGNAATFTSNATHTAGTFRWTPAAGQTGNYVVTFTATNVLSGSSYTRVQVRRHALGAASEAEDGSPVLALSEPMPNPSATRVVFELSLPVPERVTWSVYDLQGRELWSVSTELAAGRHVLEWDGADGRARRAGPGLYFARVRAGGTDFTRRFVRM